MTATVVVIDIWNILWLVLIVLAIVWLARHI